MSKKILKFIAFFAFVGFCFTNVKTVISQNGDVSSSLALSNIDKALTDCEKPSNTKLNGDCQASTSGGSCVDSIIIHDCLQP